MHWRTRDSGSGTLGFSLTVTDAFDAAGIVALVVIVVSGAYASISNMKEIKERGVIRGVTCDFAMTSVFCGVFNEETSCSRSEHICKYMVRLDLKRAYIPKTKGKI